MPTAQSAPHKQAVLHPAKVRVRLIQPCAPGTPGAVQAMGKWWKGSFDGVNGTGSQGRGFNSGSYERRSHEEGTFSLTFPNATGTDGVLHRLRFLILTAGNVRPGDEWIEIYRASTSGGAGELLFVGTPTDYQMSGASIVLTGFDGLWSLKKVRETQAGWWCNSPRDVFEEMTKTYNAVIGDGFDGASTDPKWTTSGAYTSPVPSNVRLGSNGSNSYVVSTATVLTFGAASANPALRWRAETTLTSPALRGTDYINLQLVSGAYYVLLQITATTVVMVTNPGLNKPVLQSSTFASAGTHTLVMEGRGRFIYFYLDGRLVGYLPSPTGTLISTIGVLLHTSAYDPSYYVDVDSVLVRSAQPYLMQSSTDHGDYRLPGAPAGSGLVGSYFSDTDLTVTPASAAGLGAQMLAPPRVPYMRRVDPTIAFSGAGWEPPGAYQDQTFSARWTGSIYLDLAHYDYQLYADVADGVRVWVGKTRWGEQIIDQWQAGAVTGSVVSAASTNLRSVLGSVSGWYPVIVEYQRGTGANVYSANGIARLAYNHSDKADLVVPVNVGGYSHVIAAETALVTYLPLNDAGFAQPRAISNTGPSVPYRNQGAFAYQPGPVPNDLAATFTGTNWIDTVDTQQGNTTGYAGVALEAWVNPTGVTGLQNIIRKELVFLFRLNGNRLEAYFGNGTTWTTAASTGTITPGTWTHVAVRYNPVTGDLVYYINGIAAGTGLTSVGQVGSNTRTVQIGRNDINTELFTGGIGHVALYNQALTAAQLRAHVNAQSSPSAVPTSPQGIFEQQVRNDSYYEQIRPFAESWGYQWAVRPMQLESGEFPGRMCPRVREGRDTDFVLDKDNTLSPQVSGNAEDTADTLLADAQGIADPGNSAQLFAELFNFAELGNHAILCQEYDSPGDIQQRAQLERRMGSMLALRSAPWTEVSGNATGKRELADNFPLTGALAEFSWAPGDGVRLVFPEIGVEDVTPRQILGVQWPIRPEGIGSPVIRFRQRPRSWKETLHKLMRASVVESRNYQGQLVTVTGSIGATSPSGNVDVYTRVSLPMDLTKVVQAALVVQSSAATAPWTINVGDWAVNAGTVTNPGRYDLTGYILPSQQQLYAWLTGGVGRVQYAFELLVRV